MKISIFGLGYVGAVSAACFAKLGNKITGVDTVKYKVDMINSGKSPLEEKDLSKLIIEQYSKKNIIATTDSRKAILETDISFICVGTPPKKNGDLDLTYLKRVAQEIGYILKEKSYHIIVIRSTMFPGSLDIIKSAIEKSSGKKCGKDFDLAVNPEFLREGSAIKDFFNPPYVIVGCDNPKVGDKIIQCYKGVNSKKYIVKPDLAQMIKYATNSWHGVKVDFANEIGSICKKLGIDGNKLMGLFCEDAQLNLSPYYLRPGFAYGGSCLPKDTSALKNKAKELGLRVPLINSISESNLEQIKRALELIESTGKKKIGVFGITFKADTDDIRGNPVLYLINSLKNKGYNIKIFDKLIDESDVELINQSYRKEIHDLINLENLKEKVSSISSLFSDKNSVLNQDLIIISNRDKSLKSELKKVSRNKIIIDLQNLFGKSDFDAEYIALN
jgi:GDP-mannose 6-dehydrogenase